MDGTGGIFCRQLFYVVVPRADYGGPARPDAAAGPRYGHRRVYVRDTDRGSTRASAGRADFRRVGSAGGLAGGDRCDGVRGIADAGGYLLCAARWNASSAAGGVPGGG